MAGKLPYFPFYPADWIKDTRMLSLEARAVWIDLLTLMHQDVRRGHLTAAGTPLSAEKVARFCACSVEVASRAIQELLTSGVASCTDTGVIFSRRMVRDENKRKLCTEAGKKGGNPTLKGRVKGVVNPPLIYDSEDNSLPSSDSGKRRKGVQGEGGEGFAAFWAAYPRKTAKAAALKAWDKLDPDPTLAALILKAVHRQKSWATGGLDGGKYTPHPATWLNGRRWEDQEPSGQTATGRNDGRRYRFTEGAGPGPGHGPGSAPGPGGDRPAPAGG